MSVAVVLISQILCIFIWILGKYHLNDIEGYFPLLMCEQIGMNSKNCLFMVRCLWQISKSNGM